MAPKWNDHFRSTLTGACSTLRRSSLTLTHTICQRTKPGDTKKVLWDAGARGLGLVITPAGSRTWWFVARRDGKQTWVRIGEYHAAKDEGTKGDVWTVEAAREEAARLRKMHDQGKDIRAAMQTQRAPHTIEALATSYRASVGFREMGQRTKMAYDGYLDNHILPLVGKRFVADLGYSDVVEMQGKVEAKRVPPMSVTAGYCVKLVSLMMNYACDIGWRVRGSNPCNGVKIVGAKERTRIYTAEELARIEAALGQSENAAVIRLLAFSGMRISETCALERTWANLETKALSIHEHKTRKTMGVKVIPINAAMEGVIRSSQAGRLGPWIFRGLKGTHRQAVTVQCWWAVLAKSIGIDGTLHDFRRTFQTVGVELGFPPGDMDVLVGHKLPGMQATYVHLSPGGILAQASAATSEWIRSAMAGENPRVGERVGSSLRSGSSSTP